MTNPPPPPAPRRRILICAGKPWAAGPPPADQRTLERERLEYARAGTDATAAAAALLPTLDPRARAADLAGTRAARRQRAGRPQRPGRVAQPRRPRPSGPSPPRQGQAQRHAPDFGGDHGADRRPGAGRPRRRTRLEHRHHAGEHARRAAGARARQRCPSTSTIRGCGRISSISGACSPDRSGSTTHRADDLSRWVLANPGQFDAGDLRCWRIGSDTLAVARRRAARSGRQGRAAGRRVRRAGASDRATAGS